MRPRGGVFGSGWVFVTVTPDGTLALVPKPNQDTPLTGWAAGPHGK